MSASDTLRARGHLREVLGLANTDDADLMDAAAERIDFLDEEIARLREQVARLDKLSDDLHASKRDAIVEQQKSRDRALIAERKVRALRDALLVLTDPEGA